VPRKNFWPSRKKRNWDHFYYETDVIKDRGRFFECSSSVEYELNFIELGRGVANALWMDSVIGQDHVFRAWK
jgi:hypothetical protein